MNKTNKISDEKSKGTQKKYTFRHTQNTFVCYSLIKRKEEK